MSIASVTGGTVSNYKLSNPTEQYAISPKSVVVTPSPGQSKIYGEADPTLTFTLSESISTTGALSRSAGDNAGGYDITVGTLKSASTNHVLELSATAVKFVIEKKSVTVTPDAGQSKMYGTEDPVLSYTTTGLVGSDAMTGSLSRTPGEEVGSYTITLGTLSAGDNYDTVLDAAEVTFEITPAPASSSTGLYIGVVVAIMAVAAGAGVFFFLRMRP